MRTLIFIPLPFLTVPMACTIVTQVTHTFYGYPENDPSSVDIAYDCGRGFEASGSGTYDDLLSFTSTPGGFHQCEIIYDPYTRKYLRFENTCAQCNSDWGSQIRHIDLWTGSSTVNGGQDQLDCKIDLMPDSQTIIRQPGQNLPVNSKCSAREECVQMLI